MHPSATNNDYKANIEWMENETKGKTTARREKKRKSSAQNAPIVKVSSGQQSIRISFWLAFAALNFS
jgi:hypothetical protein